MTGPKIRKARRVIDVSGESLRAEELLKFGGGVSPDGSRVALTFNGHAFEMTALLFARVVESINAMQEDARTRQGGPSGGTLH